jgi:hypothetical protein
MPKVWDSGTFWPRTGCVLDETASPATLTCQTGACHSTVDKSTAQLLDCSVSNNGGSPTNPVTQFEVTSTASSLNYDVSIASGFNVEVYADPVGGGRIKPGTPATQIAACFSAGCTADLNATCPDNLKLYDTGDPTKVIGCVDPCRKCDDGSTALKCSDTFEGQSYTDCSAGTGNVTYYDMYCAKNKSDGYAQASPNQGTPTAFGAADCFPDTGFVIPAFASGYALPAGQGVCLYIGEPQTDIAHFNDYGWADAASSTTKNCGGTTADSYTPLADGTPCGGYLTKQADNSTGYPEALGYTCQTATYTDSLNNTKTAHLCMPPVNSGLGTCKKNNSGNAPLYTGVGGVSNESWLTAGITAGGGSVPYYETFKAACPAAYTWQYDDLASGFGCDPTKQVTNGSAFTGFNVTFCKSSSPFCAGNAAKIYGGSTEYDNIDEAYAAAATSQTIQARAVTITEDIVLNSDKEILLAGGYDCNFSAQSGVTTISGSLTISDGKVTADRITIR